MKMFMNSLVVCVILAVLQTSVMASEVSEELLQQHVLGMQQQIETMQRQLATEKQEMQQEKNDDVQIMKQLLQGIQLQMAAEREEMQQQMATERQARQEEMEKMQIKVEKIEQQMTSKTEEMQQQQLKQQQQQQRMQQKMNHIEIENTKLKQKISNINVKLANVVHENQLLSEVVSVLKQDHYDLSLGFQNVSDMVSQAVDAKHNGSFIGFSAYPSESREYNDGILVMFDSVITNVGSFYTPETSAFLCPIDGYYLFSVNVHTATGFYIGANLIMDGNAIAYVYADEAEQDSASNTVVVFCPQFKQVYVRASGDGNRMWGGFNSMFTGILLLQQ